MHLHLLFICLFFASYTSFAQSSSLRLGQEYIAAWKAFYPSQAVGQGLHDAIFQYEDRSKESIDQWISYNQKCLTELTDEDNVYVQNFPIDARLLRNQTAREVYTWTKEQPHYHDLAHYVRLLQRAVSSVESASYLDAPQRDRLYCQRLAAMGNLASAAQKNLQSFDPSGLARAEGQILRIKQQLEELETSKKGKQACSDFAERLANTQKALSKLETFLKEGTANNEKQASILGRDVYADQLALYTDLDLTPKELSKIALAEIKLVRELMGEVSRDYLTATYPEKELPRDLVALVRLALADMEKDAPTGAQDYLEFWQDLRDQAVSFIRENEIATLPEFQTLRIQTAPESAGAAARIGWVDSAPPFAPNPVTTLYLPSIPDTLPKQEQIDFWSSFNKPFNRMIVIHELFPGHYMQIKVSRETAHPVRLLFPYRPYFEGWATFTERVLLDAGWEKERPLTFLAHLRKRIENANRAYTSAQVHCFGWDQDQVQDFSIEQSLLAPQFAKSLWGRIMRSPMQLTSYFWGGQQFSQLLEMEKQRLGDDFVLRDFMDAIMRAGAIPIDEFPDLLEKTNSK